MPDYTRLGLSGEIFMRTQDSYAAFIRNDAMYVRPTNGIVRIDDEGRIFVTAPSSNKTERPDVEARLG